MSDKATRYGANEPVMVSAAVAWLLLQVGALLVGRLGLLSGGTWSAMSSALAPIVTGVVCYVGGLVVRRYVSPAWRAAKRDVVPAVKAVTPDAVDRVIDGAVARANELLARLDAELSGAGARHAAD